MKDAHGPEVVLRRSDWEMRTVSLDIAQNLVKKYHYSGGGSNSATYRHGLFKKSHEFNLGDDECFGVAWWIPPTKDAAFATYPKNWQGVLALTRLVITPDVPKNGASFLLGKSMAAIDRERWPCLVTYADEMQGHTGAIYRATNWEYCGMTAKESTFFFEGRMVARKAGPKTRTQDEMLSMGCKMVGRFAKHKFRHLVDSAKTFMTETKIERYRENADNHLCQHVLDL